MPARPGQRLSSFADPEHQRIAGWIVVGLLCFIGYLLRSAIGIAGVTDVDVVNFGLASLSFDPLMHQPHPPGYPGYVAVLQIVGGLPGLGDPIATAKLSSILCSIGMIPACYWLCGVLSPAPGSLGRRLAAASFATFHPLLLFYGGDGQIHAAEALGTILSIGLLIRGKNRSSASAVAAIAFMALCGSVRPTLVVFAIPAAIWLLMGRRPRVWLAAAAVVAVITLSWITAAATAAGGFDVYRRSTNALIGDLFISNFSIASSNASAVLANLRVVAIATAIASIPLLAARMPKDRWRGPLFAVGLINIAFYAVSYCAESGYFAPLAALTCLVPATWPQGKVRVIDGARATFVVVAGIVLFFILPGSTRLALGVEFPLPTFTRLHETESNQRLYQTAVCSAAGGRRTLVLTDNPMTTINRWLPLACEGLLVAQHVHDLSLQPDLDAWLIYRHRGLSSLPSSIPLEPGPPSSITLRNVEQVVLAPDASDAWKRRVIDSASCPPSQYDASATIDSPIDWWPQRCLTDIAIGAHHIFISD